MSGETDVQTTSKQKSGEENIYELHKTCVAQSNWYTSKAGEMYFVARNDVMVELTNQMVNYYNTSRGTTSGADRRNEAYARFYQWLKSKVFTDDMNSEYEFGDPFLVGSAWTPLRRDDSTIDIIINVQCKKETTTEELFRYLIKARDIFVEKLFKTFTVVNEIISHDTFVTFGNGSFKICAQFTINRASPSFSVRLSSAMNQYDDFLHNFSPMAFLLQSWFKQVKSLCVGTEKVVIPSSSSINYLLIFYLQYYEFIPFFFDSNLSSGKSKLLNYRMTDIINYKISAYDPELYHHYKNFERALADKVPNAGELITMFFFFYGYLADLPHVILRMKTAKMSEKLNINCDALCFEDTEHIGGNEVPDAYRLQFLCRQAFHTIINIENEEKILETLFQIRYDGEFNLVRDRITTNDVDRYSAFQKGYQLVLNSDGSEQKYHSRRQVFGFTFMQSGQIKRYQRDGKATEMKDDSPVPPFSDEMHAMKNCFKKPDFLESNVSCKDDKNLMQRRAEGMFTLRVLPNPNAMHQLSVFFRPPINLDKKLIPIVEYNVNRLLNTREKVNCDDPNFFDLARTGCFEELGEMETIREYYNIGSPTGISYESLELLIAMYSSKACSEEENVEEKGSFKGFEKGFLTFSQFKEHLEELEHSWFEEAKEMIDQDSIYIRLDEFK